MCFYFQDWSEEVDNAAKRIIAENHPNLNVSSSSGDYHRNSIPRQTERHRYSDTGTMERRRNFRSNSRNSSRNNSRNGSMERSVHNRGSRGPSRDNSHDRYSLSRNEKHATAASNWRAQAAPPITSTTAPASSNNHQQHYHQNNSSRSHQQHQNHHQPKHQPKHHSHPDSHSIGNKDHGTEQHNKKQIIKNDHRSSVERKSTAENDSKSIISNHVVIAQPKSLGIIVKTDEETTNQKSLAPNATIIGPIIDSSYYYDRPAWYTAPKLQMKTRNIVKRLEQADNKLQMIVQNGHFLEVKNFDYSFIFNLFTKNYIYFFLCRHGTYFLAIIVMFNQYYKIY